MTKIIFKRGEKVEKIWHGNFVSNIIQILLSLQTSIAVKIRNNLHKDSSGEKKESL